MTPESQIYRETTDTYLNSLPIDDLIDPVKIEKELLEMLEYNIRTENAARSQDMQIKIPVGLPPEVVAHVLLRLYPIVKLSYTPSGEPGNKILALYQEFGPDAGLFVADDEEIGRLIRRYNYRFRSKAIKDVLYQLSLEAPVRYLTTDRDLIAVNNGIFDYKNKMLMPFDSDHVFISKSRVDYNPFAQNPVIQNDDGTLWDVESWMDYLTDDPAIKHLLWQIVGAVIRPNVSWNKAPIFYATRGNNGKGTLCVLMRNLCGPGTHTSIPLANMGKDFMLESLIHATAVITDENDVSTFLDKCANFKSLVTQDPVQVNRKGKPPVTVKFRGLVVECMNDLPRLKDKSDSFARRLLIIPFEKRFEGRENKSIKDDYLNRKDVLEYVLFKVLNMDYYSFIDPKACLDMLGEFKAANDPVRQFLEEVLPKARWDVLPYNFLWDVYTRWFKQDTPAGTMIGKNTFIDRVAEAVDTTPEWGWTAPNRKNAFRVRRGCMECYEPMLEEYGLTEKWGAVMSGPEVPPLRMVQAHYSATPGNRFLQKLIRGLTRMSDEQIDTALAERTEKVLAEFAEWFWTDPADGLAWYIAGLQGGAADEAQAAHKLASSKDDIYRVMPVRRDFQQHRVLDRRYSAGELVTAVQDYWFKTHGGEDDLAAAREQAEETLNGFADWFWNNGLVEYQIAEPTVITIAPENARSYAENTDELVQMLVNAIKSYQNRDLLQMLFTINELMEYLPKYWSANYDRAAGQGET